MFFFRLLLSFLAILFIIHIDRWVEEAPIPRLGCKPIGSRARPRKTVHRRDIIPRASETTLYLGTLHEAHELYAKYFLNPPIQSHRKYGVNYLMNEIIQVVYISSMQTSCSVFQFARILTSSRRIQETSDTDTDNLDDFVMLLILRCDLVACTEIRAAREIRCFTGARRNLMVYRQVARSELLSPTRPYICSGSHNDVSLCIKMQ